VTAFGPITEAVHSWSYDKKMPAKFTEHSKADAISRSEAAIGGARVESVVLCGVGIRDIQRTAVSVQATAAIAVPQETAGDQFHKYIIWTSLEFPVYSRCPGTST